MTARLQVLVRGDPDDARRVLAELADKSIHLELTARAIWHHLEREGHPPRDLAGNPALKARLNKDADRFVKRLRRRLPADIQIARREAAQILRAINGGDRYVVVTGGAGMGKSLVLAQVITDVRARGWSVLPLRADRIPNSDSPEALGRAMDLPASPITVLAGVSHGEPALLVIDQLDAVSEISGRNVDRFDVFEDLTHDAALHSGLHVLVLIACRRFDLENDSRLRQLTADEDTTTVDVAKLSDDEVRTTLATAGAADSQLDARLLKLLRVPLHLSLYLELRRGGSADPSKSRSLQDLYGCYWDAKQLACEQRRGGADQWTTVVDRLVEEMNRRQALSVPYIPLRDDYRAQVDAMVSEGVLDLDDRHIGFFHDTFLALLYN